MQFEIIWIWKSIETHFTGMSKYQLGMKRLHFRNIKLEFFTFYLISSTLNVERKFC